MATKNQRERRANLRDRLSNEEDALREICDHIADGGTLYDLSVSWKIKYRHLYLWLHDEVYPDRLTELRKAEDARANLQTEALLGQLHNIGNLDIRRAYNADGKLLDVKDMPDDIARAISGIEILVNEGGDVTKKIKFTDRGAMLALNAKRLRLIVDRTELTGANGGPIETTDAKAKLLGRLVPEPES